MMCGEEFQRSLDISIHAHAHERIVCIALSLFKQVK